HRVPCRARSVHGRPCLERPEGSVAGDQRADPLDRGHQLRDLPDPLRRYLVRAPEALAAAGRLDRRGRRLGGARLPGLRRLRLPVRPDHRAPDQALGPPLRPPGAGSRASPPPGLMAGGAPAGGPGRTRGRHPAVSIVVATHNRSAWLRAAIDSVLAQDYPELEFLVVDDGSTDETPSVLEEYARRNPPRRFRFMRQENQGQARSLNRGYLLARGAISRLAGELIADPDAAAAYPGYRVIDGEGRLVDTVRPIEYSSVE